MANIRKRKDKWQVQIRRKNAQTITRSFVKRTDAREWGNTMEAQADRLELPSYGRELLKGTFRDLLERYDREIASQKNCYPSENYSIKKLMRCEFTSKKLEQISEADFIEYKHKRLREVKPATFNREIAVMRHVFNVAKREWQIPVKNPLADFQKPRVMNERERRLSPDEYKKLVDALPKSLNEYLPQIINLALETAMRRSELLNIKLEHINFSNKTLLIPVTKTGYSRTIPLSPTALKILNDAEYQKGGGLFPITPNALRLSWGRLLKRAGISNLHFHDLRHEAISRFFEKGLSVPEVTLISGHRSYKMLMRYTHVKPESIVEKL